MSAFANDHKFYNRKVRLSRRRIGPKSAGKTRGRYQKASYGRKMVGKFELMFLRRRIGMIMSFFPFFCIPQLSQRNVALGFSKSYRRCLFSIMWRQNMPPFS
jgi:hypothetical protein